MACDFRGLIFCRLIFLLNRRCTHRSSLAFLHGHGPALPDLLSFAWPALASLGDGRAAPRSITRARSAGRESGPVDRRRRSGVSRHGRASEGAGHPHRAGRRCRRRDRHRARARLASRIGDLIGGLRSGLRGRGLCNAVRPDARPRRQRHARRLRRHAARGRRPDRLRSRVSARQGHGEDRDRLAQHGERRWPTPTSRRQAVDAWAPIGMTGPFAAPPKEPVLDIVAETGNRASARNGARTGRRRCRKTRARVSSRSPAPIITSTGRQKELVVADRSFSRTRLRRALRAGLIASRANRDRRPRRALRGRAGR